MKELISDIENILLKKYGDYDNVTVDKILIICMLYSCKSQTEFMNALIDRIDKEDGLIPCHKRHNR